MFIEIRCQLFKSTRRPFSSHKTAALRGTLVNKHFNNWTGEETSIFILLKVVFYPVSIWFQETMEAIRGPLCVAVLVVITVGVAKATFEDLSDVGIDFSQAVLMKDIEFAQGIAFNDAQEIELEEVQNAPSVSLPVTR